MYNSTGSEYGSDGSADQPRPILAAVASSPGAPLELSRLLLDPPGPGEVIVRIVACGLCQTDEKAAQGAMPLPLPAVLGHEGAGIVESIGPGVQHYEEGDRVLIGWPYCGHCAACEIDEHRYCSELRQLAFSGMKMGSDLAEGMVSGYHRPNGEPVYGHFFGQSSLATHSLVSEIALVPVPAEFPLDLAGPLACGLATGAGAIFNSLTSRRRIAIIGAGAVGFGALMAALVSGWREIIVVDRQQERLELARSLGATQVIRSTGTALPELLRAKVDAVVECTGKISLVEQSVDCIGPLGVCLLLGGAPAGERFSAEQFGVLWGKRIQGVLGGGGTSRKLLGRLMRLYLGGQFPFDRLLTFYDLKDINQARADSQSGTVIKPVIRMPDLYHLERPSGQQYE